MSNNIQLKEQIKANQIAQILNSELIGNKEELIIEFATNPKNAKQGSCCLLFSKNYIEYINTEIQASLYIIPIVLEELIKEKNINYITVERERLAMKILLDYIAKNIDNNNNNKENKIHKTAVLSESSIIGTEGIQILANSYIGENVKIGNNTKIMPNCYIGNNTVIGTDCIIYPGVVIYDNTIIGNGVIIHANSTIGSDGFSFVTERESSLEILQKKPQANLAEIFEKEIHENNPHLKIQSLGQVIIEDMVEIGSTVCIDRGTLGATIIGAGTKIGNLVHIAHNCNIGRDCLIITLSGLAGSVKLGDRVIIAGKAGCKEGITIGHDSILLATSNANKSHEPFSLLMGLPAIPAKEYFDREKQMRRLLRKNK